MAKLLMNLRNVPEDEADEVRAWLRDNGLEFYETTPSPWGISGGGIWISNDADIVRARTLMDEYQQQRRQQALARQADAERDGSAETFAGSLRERPLLMLGKLLAIIGVLAFTLALPHCMLR